MDWIDAEIDALDQQLERGEISREEHWDLVLELRSIAKDQEDRDSIKAAGRGHLLK